MRHVNLVDLFEAGVQIRWTLLFELLLRLQYFLGLASVLLAPDDLLSYGALEFARFEHVSEHVHYGIVML